MSRREYERFLGEPREAAAFLSQITHDASNRLSSRIFIEDQHIPLTGLPLGGEQGLRPILSFLPLAKEGFALNLTSDRLRKDQIVDVLKETSPNSGIVSRELKALGIALRPHILTPNPRLSLYRHTEATIVFLSSKGAVDAEGLDLNDPKKVRNVSHWPYKPTIENIWELCSELEEATRRMILDPAPVTRRESALRATHFFAAGNRIAQALVAN